MQYIPFYVGLVLTACFWSSSMLFHVSVGFFFFCHCLVVLYYGYSTFNLLWIISKVYKYLLPLKSPSHPPPRPAGLAESTRLSSLCYTEAYHQLSDLPTVVYKCQCYSLNSSHSLLPQLCPQVLSLHLCLYSCPAHFPRFHIYALI